MPANEQDLRLDVLNTLLTTPHRQLAAIHPIHQDMAQKDPRFYVRLAAWYNDNGAVRDHKEMFVVTLALSSFPGHRDVGLALLRQLPVWRRQQRVEDVKSQVLLVCRHGAPPLASSPAGGITRPYKSQKLRVTARLTVWCLYQFGNTR